MKRDSYRDLLALASCLDGRLPSDVDWDAVIGLANKSMTISSLAAAMGRYARPEDIPGEVRAYLAEIYRRNAQRNARLNSQLKEAVSCLNGIGIEPVAMKGAAILLAQRQSEIGARMLTDLDIFVRPADMPRAIGALQGIGYVIREDAGAGSWPGNPKFRLPVVLARPQDAGSIDLQCRPKGPAAFSDIEWVYRNGSRMTLDGAHVYVPSPFAQIVYLMLHDQFQDGDYWRGLVDVRHLLDIANIARSTEEMRWEALRSLFAQGYERHAIDTQILTASILFNISSDLTEPCGTLPKLQLARRKIQLERGYLRGPFTLLTLLTELLHYPSWDRFGGEPHASRWQEVKRKARELRRIFRPIPPGKA
ncbi:MULTISPECIES: nucleotidyltransferase family protein [unclassified Sinorhizobium]|uniref:nucleotidyltransferase family protein n=1 Tax=unclassified Sinorhizobium TaxID=2613772 RepID=UPI0024C283CD|nr:MULTISPECIES: nucleotidyltransferase family protein [unclassified Sinorhizobium]MDK1375183.1 nucleotidyltransferase family protein [Sinorhizobium sp. 6-70]MDK1480923.1 nucleotidyltransferase family protein [Sinorhizobium sp. 6-117]